MISIAASAIQGATLVLGATGNTGKHVVQQLLNLDRPVHVIVRSKERLLSALEDASKAERLLTITEESLLDLTDAELQVRVNHVDNVICCLGHNLSFKGIFGHPRRLVADSVERLAKSLAQTTGPTRRKLILMSSDGVVHPAGTDDKLGFWARLILGFCHHCLPPHSDNEAAAMYLYNLAGSGNMEWIVLRPTDLVNGKASGGYNLSSKPVGGLFGSQVVTRANVAKCMVDFIVNDELFTEYRFRMPVIHDATQPRKSNNAKQA